MDTQKKLLEVIQKIENPCLFYACREITNPTHPTPFTLWPASLSHHHDYAGGLMRHTLEVCQIALDLLKSGSLRALNMDVVLTACLWHDYGKTEEYVMCSEPTDRVPDRRYLSAWNGTCWTKRDCIPDKFHPHIEWSANHCVAAINRHGRNVKDEIVEHIADCILSHHGRIEWGSPFEPKTAEAILVHQADMLSAHLGYARK